MLEKLKRITKATIPKVVHAAEAVGKSLAKSAKTAEKKIQSSMAGKLIGKAVAAVPTKVSKVGSIALKTAAAVPKSVQTHVKKVNIIREVGANITQTTNSVNKNGTEIKKVETLQKSQRIFEKIQEANKVFFTDFVKGTTGKGALLFWPNVVLQNELPGVYNPRIEAMSYLVKIRKAVVEEYPIINWKVDLYKNLKQKLNSSMEISGNQIYNKNIPFLSDNFGALTNCSDYQKNGNRTPLDKPLYRTINAALIILTPGLDCGVMSDTSIGMAKRLIDNTNIASSKGAYDRGFLIEGAGGMIDGLVSLAINPFDMAEGIVNIYKEPEKYIPVICNEIIDYVNDKIIHGSPEDRAKFKGRLDFEIISFIALSALGKGSEAPKALQKSTEAEKGVAEGGKIVEEFNETVKATEGLTTIGKLENAGKSFEKLIDKMRKFIRGEIGSEELLTEELGQAAKSKTGVSINKTEVISKEAGNVGKAEAFEGAGDAGKAIKGSGKTIYDINGKYTGGRTQSELDALKYDPAKKAITSGSKNEAQIGLDLEEKGIIGQLERSADPKAEFIDSLTGKKYDVKSFESTPIGSDGVPITSPRKGAFKVENAIKNVVKEFEKNGNDVVIIDKSKLIPEHVNELRNAIEEAGLTDKIIWWPE